MKSKQCYKTIVINDTITIAIITIVNKKHIGILLPNFGEDKLI